MTHEEPELLVDIIILPLFYMILRHKAFKWLEWSIESDLGMQFAIWNLQTTEVSAAKQLKLITLL